MCIFLPVRSCLPAQGCHIPCVCVSSPSVIAGQHGCACSQAQPPAGFLLSPKPCSLSGSSKAHMLRCAACMCQGVRAGDAQLRAQLHLSQARLLMLTAHFSAARRELKAALKIEPSPQVSQFLLPARPDMSTVSCCMHRQVWEAALQVPAGAADRADGASSTCLEYMLLPHQQAAAGRELHRAFCQHSAMQQPLHLQICLTACPKAPASTTHALAKGKGTPVIEPAGCMPVRMHAAAAASTAALICLEPLSSALCI